MNNLQKVLIFKTVSLRHLILAFSLFFLLANCTSKKDDNKVELKLQSSKVDIANSVNILGKWKYNFPFYSSELTILENGTFHFFSQACMGQSYSEGNWYWQWNDIVINSFDKYKEDKDPILITTQQSVKTKKIPPKKKNSKIEFEFDPSALNSIVSFKFPDTSNTYFDHVRFVFKDDALHKLDKDGAFTETKFRRENDMYFLPKLPPLPPVFPDIQKVNDK